MKRHLFQPVILTLLLCFGSTSLAGTQTRAKTFRFGKVDLEFLAQIKQLDKRFEDKGLIYRDPELNAYVDRMGRSLLKDELCRS
jgi:hypothetical protein